jgi:RNA polymerase sigma-B factor
VRGGDTGLESGELEDRFVEFAHTGDPAIREELVRAYLPLAEYLAKRFVHRGVPSDDLVQVASLGLVKAVDRFEPERGLAFSTFATPTIIGELKRHFRDKGWALRVPRRLQELHLELASTIGSLTQELGRSPTIAEIAAAARVSEEEVLEATDVAQVYRISSLEAPPTEEGDTGDSRSAALSEIDGNLELVEERMEIARLLRALPPRQRAIVHMRFFEGKTQSEIAASLGISQMHVSRLLARSIDQLRQEGRGSPPTGSRRTVNTTIRRDDAWEAAGAEGI